MSKKTGGPAFPIPIAGCTDGGIYSALEKGNGELGGMTLWDAYSMAGANFAASPQFVGPMYQGDPSGLAEFCMDYADAMIAGRKKRFEDSNV